jgi:hypothetical protein
VAEQAQGVAGAADIRAIRGGGGGAEGDRHPIAAQGQADRGAQGLGDPVGRGGPDDDGDRLAGRHVNATRRSARWTIAA